MSGTVILDAQQGTPDRLPVPFGVQKSYPDSIGLYPLVELVEVQGGEGVAPSRAVFDWVPTPDSPNAEMPIVDMLWFCQDVPALARAHAEYGIGNTKTSVAAALQVSIDGGSNFIGNIPQGRFDDGVILVGQAAVPGSPADPVANLLNNPSPSDLQQAQGVRGDTVTNAVRVAGQPMQHTPIARGLFDQLGNPSQFYLDAELHSQAAVQYGFASSIYETGSDVNNPNFTQYQDVFVREDQYTAAIAQNGNIVLGNDGVASFFVTRVVGVWALRSQEPPV